MGWPRPVAMLLAAFGAVSGLLAAAPETRDRLPPGFEQVRHVAWHPEDGAPTNIQGIAQSTDGFLWLASANGLYRFDGVSFERIPLEGGDGNQSLQVASVAAVPNGDVWIGYDWGGMAVYHRGHLRPNNPGKPDKTSVYLTATRDGAIWARANGRKGNRLIRFKDGNWIDIDESWNLPIGTGTIAFLVASDHSLYLLNPDGIRRLRPGARRFEFQPLKLGDGPTLAEDPRGRIWVADADRLMRVEIGKGQVGPVTPVPHSNLYRRLAFDVDGAAWLAGADDGVRRLLPDATGERFQVEGSLFSVQDDISSPVTLSMVRDSERNIWVGTVLGIDRFSPRRAIRDAGSAFSHSYAFDSFAGADGENYLISNHGLFRIAAGGPEKLATIRGAETGCASRDTVIVATPFQLYAYRDGKLRKMATPSPGDDRGSGTIRACAFDTRNRLLLSIAHHPLYRLEGERWQPIVSIETGTRSGVYGMLPSADGGMVLIYPQDKILHFAGERTELLWSTSQAKIGFLKTATQGRKCMLFGAQNGLGCLAGNTMKTIDAATYPQLTNVTGIVETDEGWTWLIALPGIVRVKTDELAAAFEAPGRPLHFQPFGIEEGLRGETMMMYPRDAIADRFGRLWFFTASGLASLDLNRLAEFAPPPQVIVKSLTANGQSYKPDGPITLPIGTRSFQIDYTATTLTDPKGTAFRYRLEGVDDGWIEAGGRRQAFYTNLSPGSYRFRVAAVSSAGASSRQDAVVEVVIEPSFIQTRTFAVLCIVLALVLGTLLYQWRVRSLAARMAERLQERLGERERIARELHDTLLQGVAGLLLQIQGLAARSPDRKLRDDMETALDRAEDLVTEGRNRVRMLRGGDGPRNLEETLAIALTQQGLGNTIEVRLERSGTVRDVAGPVAEELAAIAIEALNNAIRHGQASRLTVTMAFERRRLTVTFEDDGIGIPKDILAAGGREGHYGLVGMRERVARLRGVIEIETPDRGGTRIGISIPRRSAYPRSMGLLGRKPH